MQTFMPYPDFFKSIDCLDKKRCLKQAVEASQIINCLTGIGSLRWKNHPAVKMWRGYTNSLIQYHNCAVALCGDKWKFNLKKLRLKLPITSHTELPFWFGDTDFHKSHQSNLYRKNPVYYRQFEYVGGELPYVWPSAEHLY